MKRWLIALTALAVLSLACVPLALAASHSSAAVGHVKAHVKFQCEATVVSVDTTTTLATLMVTVKSGSKTIRLVRHQQITVQLDPKAKLIDATVDPSLPLTLDQLAPGAKVHLGGKIDRPTADPSSWTFTAMKVILQRLPAVQ
jgi:hypothetical protein